MEALASPASAPLSYRVPFDDDPKSLWRPQFPKAPLPEALYPSLSKMAHQVSSHQKLDEYTITSYIAEWAASLQTALQVSR